MNYSFLTVCSSDNYLTGVLALNESLKAVNSKFPLQVLITQNTSSLVKEKLNQLGIETIYVEKEIKLPNELIEKNNKSGYSHWNRTLYKLWMFELVQFDKLVYLDSDMFVLHNIDELFDKPHMSAVVAGKQYPGNEAWKLLNSGCMVIVPEQGILDEFLQVIPDAMKKRHNFGDQDVLQVYYQDWTKIKELELDEKYK
ncbi:glycosyltransferase [Turicibacter bilis]|uniref:glycosyltransferase n=1 Tax=Turicibacter bilis TaxID=2735723 RepID=UPI0031B9AEFA